MFSIRPQARSFVRGNQATIGIGREQGPPAALAAYQRVTGLAVFLARFFPGERRLACLSVAAMPSTS